MTDEVKRKGGESTILGIAAVFLSVWTWASYARWANFEYRSFDLAFYVQGIWQLIHGRFDVSVEHVPLLGNHVEPIVFLIAPLFAVFRHPMVFVVTQNVALAAMGPIAYDIGKRLGMDRRSALLLSAALLVTPATGYVALHEFHPEALSAPLLLLMFRARLTRSPIQHWFWFLGVLACKENMALLLAAYCTIYIVVERKRELGELRTWYLWPLTVSIAWFLVCTQIITPALNSGKIDYLGLYSHLGKSPGEIVLTAITQPRLIARTLRQSLTHGNLAWALLFPFLCLPLLRPRWLLIATPIFLQHLLSWRVSEWQIYFHYAAPLVTLLWIGTAEAVAGWKVDKPLLRASRPALSLTVLLVCVVAQTLLGPAGNILFITTHWFGQTADRARKNALIAQIPPQASILAPLPYLSHLALREKLYSLHYILKGLKTLSRSPYEMPPTPDFVLIDYGDSSTFDSFSGYYHPTMKTVDGAIIPSSDQLLHNFLERSAWFATSRDELTLLRRDERQELRQTPNSADSAIAENTRLMSITKSGGTLSEKNPLEIKLDWIFPSDRKVFPWMFLKLTQQGGSNPAIVTKGLCAPEAGAGPHTETWYLTADGLTAGDYMVEAVFINNCELSWSRAVNRKEQSTSLLQLVSIGNIKVIKK